MIFADRIDRVSVSWPGIRGHRFKLPSARFRHGQIHAGSTGTSQGREDDPRTRLVWHRDRSNPDQKEQLSATYKSVSYLYLTAKPIENPIDRFPLS